MISTIERPVMDHSSSADPTPRERELGAIIDTYNQVTEQLRQSHDKLNCEVVRLRKELAGKNRQLQRRERLAALGELAAGVAHEIRNPLGGIRLFASLLRRDLSDRGDAVRLVDKIINGVSRLESIVGNILEFGRPRQAMPMEVDPLAVVREVVELASPRARQNEVAVRLPENAVPLTLITDESMLQRALLNLMLNAIDAAGQNGGQRWVQVECRDELPDHVVIRVSDSGPGIPEESLERIFNPFFTTKGTGTGLGLAIVHQISETLGGSIQAMNRPGGGAAFVLRLPRTMDVALEDQDAAS